MTDAIVAGICRNGGITAIVGWIEKLQRETKTGRSRPLTNRPMCEAQSGHEAFFERLINAGKTAKVPLAAIMSKLILLANSFIKQARKRAQIRA